MPAGPPTRKPAPILLVVAVFLTAFAVAGHCTFATAEGRERPESTANSTTTTRCAGRLGECRGSATSAAAERPLSVQQLRQRGRALAQSLFTFAFDNYMLHAFPEDELDPIHCTGRSTDLASPDNININDVLGNYSLTLIDSLDTLAVMGDTDGFAHAVRLVLDTVSFDQDRTVQVFEATIRVLGGLLSAHIIAERGLLDMHVPGYSGGLLDLARDLGSRLLPAFENTPMGLPHPRVNLQHGVPLNARTDTNPAGAGSLILEFGVLSRLTGDPTYEGVARRALASLVSRRHPVTGLLGSSIDMITGTWLDTTSGMGASVDSLFEYLFKSYVLLDDASGLHAFDYVFGAAYQHTHIPHTPLFVNVDMATAVISNSWLDSLQAYLPALLVLAGHVEMAANTHAYYYNIWKRYGAFPERYNWQLNQPDIPVYPLRPEFAESTYALYRATRDPLYLRIGLAILEDLQQHTRVRCGFATLHDVETGEKEDRMESFFLSETLKYLFLLFDEENKLHEMDVVFSTEAHFFPVDIGNHKGRPGPPTTCAALTWQQRFLGILSPADRRRIQMLVGLSTVIIQ
eukprot:m.116661 g.116661  ORF g.116661 m.116661 type:complete len:573 (-) comp9504_c1_seq2:202-1920(-)